MQNVPTLEKAVEYLEEAAKINPGSWIAHSKNVALGAKLIAERCNDINPNIAYILGLLHDIGKREVKTQARHCIDGYKFMMSQGYEDSARICMTHTFQYKDINAIYDKWDCSEEELMIVANYLKAIQYNKYDLLIQLCDALSTEKGFCFLEKKMVSSVIKCGIKDILVEKWGYTFRLKEHFEKETNCSIYSLLPNVIDDIFNRA